MGIQLQVFSYKKFKLDTCYWTPKSWHSDYMTNRHAENQSRSRILELALFRPKRLTLIFFRLPQNRIKLTLNMLNFLILCDLFPFSTFYCANEGKMFKSLIILKGSILLDVMHVKFRDLLLNVTLICCAS